MNCGCAMEKLARSDMSIAVRHHSGEVDFDDWVTSLDTDGVDGVHARKYMEGG